MFVHLLGFPLVEMDGGPRKPSLSRSAWLLFYLAYHQEWVSRDTLAYFLRPEADKEVGRGYLRKLLNGARQIPWAEGLEVEAQQLRWQVNTDVTLFLKAAQAGRWFEALQLYQGPLLEGLSADPLPSYEIWLEDERAMLERVWRNVSVNYALDLESTGQHQDAVSVAENLLKLDDLDEDALHLYLRNLYLSGQREQALKLGQDFYRRLRELELDPTQTTRQLMDAIRSATPLPKQTATRRSGRRKTDHSVPDPEAHLRAFLAIPGSRILALNAVDDDVAVTVTKRIPNVRLALSGIVDLAERLISQRYYERAQDLLMMVLSQPKCDDILKQRIARLYQEIGKRR